MNRSQDHAARAAALPQQAEGCLRAPPSAAAVREQAEEVLRASEELKTAILNSVSAHIAVLDRHGVIVAVNASWQRFALENPAPAGEPVRNAGIGADYLQVCRECGGEEAESARAAQDGIQAVLEGHLPNFTFEYPCHSPNEQRWFSMSATPLGQEGRGVVISHQNITERKQAEEALRKSEGRYRAVVEDQTEVISRFREEGAFTFVNDVFCRFFGKAAEELLGKKWQPVAIPEDLPHLEEQLKTLSPSKPVVMIENRVYAGSGRVHWMQFVNRGFFDARGRLTEIQSVGRDITERKQAEEVLRLQTERLQIMHEIKEGILLAQSQEAVARAALDRLARLVPCQRASVCLFDLDAREATVLAVWSRSETQVGAGRRFPLGEHAEKLRQGQLLSVTDLMAAGLTGAVPQALQTEGIRSVANIPLIADGEVIGALNLGVVVPGFFTPPHLELAQEVAGFMAARLANLRLLEQVHQHHAALKALTARLVEVGESERRRLATELHDQVGQKLTLLSIGLDFVRRQVAPEAPPVVQARLDDCQHLVAETAERMREVMAELRPPVLDDYGVLAALRWHGGQFAQRTGLEVIVQGEEPIPRLASAKETALFRIAQEALTNTVKHAQARRVTMDLQVAADRVWLTVADDGSGFRPQSLPSGEAALHWGLLTMREQAEAVGGSLDVEAAPGQGTRILVEMPR